MPFSERVPTGFSSKCGSTSCRVVSLITTVPGSASPCRRAATLGTDPARAEPSRTPEASPAITTVPEWTPTRMAGSMPWRRCSSMDACAIRSTSRSAASTARRASSSWAVGYPKHATTPSPWNWSTRPPSSSMVSDRHPAVEDEDVLNDLRLGHLGHVGRLDDVGEDQTDEGALAPGQGTFERRPFEHGCGAPVRRIDGQHVVGQLDHAVPRSDRRGGVHGSQKPIDQQRQAVFCRRRPAVPRARSRRRLSSLPPTGWAWLT